MERLTLEDMVVFGTGRTEVLETRGLEWSEREKVESASEKTDVLVLPTPFVHSNSN